MRKRKVEVKELGEEHTIENRMGEHRVKLVVWHNESQTNAITLSYEEAQDLQIQLNELLEGHND